MCGRFTLTMTDDEIEQLFEVEGVPKLPARHNVAPTQPVIGIRETPEGVREAALLKWGLIPHWSKDMGIGARMINARGETVADKPSFRTPFKRRRCLVPANGFYEWQERGGGKQPHYIHMQDGSPLAMAGLWDAWQQGEEAYIESCTIITTSPNDVVRPLHDRMPVILEPEDWSLWLDTSIEDASQLLPLLEPCPGEAMAAYPVSRHVNNPRNDDAKCIAPAGGPEERSWLK